MRPFIEWGRRLFSSTCRIRRLCVVSRGFVIQRIFLHKPTPVSPGTVSDSSGAVIAGANVTITNQGTGIQTHTTTSSAGTYAVTGLTPGHLFLSIEGSGFKKFVQNSINIEVSTTNTVNIASLPAQLRRQWR